MSCSNKFHILEIQDLSISFRQYEKGIRQVDLPVISRLNVTVHEGEIVAVVGSSGSGKSLLAHAILGLLPSNAMCSGEFFFLQEPLTPERMEKLRGKEIALVPQSVTYLDPLMKVGKQVRRGRRDRETVSRQRELFSQYGLAQEVEEKYPFACSGGMSRRILLATALMENPRLIIADEPTPGMELSLAGKAMEDFRRFADMGNGVLLITHDIDLALQAADRIAVFYAGTTVEVCPASDFEKGKGALRHPYSKAFLDALPQNEFKPIAGTQPYAGKLPSGCLFADRCPKRTESCGAQIEMRTLRGGKVRCVHAT